MSLASRKQAINIQDCITQWQDPTTVSNWYVPQNRAQVTAGSKPHPPALMQRKAEVNPGCRLGNSGNRSLHVFHLPRLRNAALIHYPGNLFWYSLMENLSRTRRQTWAVPWYISLYFGGCSGLGKLHRLSFTGYKERSPNKLKCLVALSFHRFSLSSNPHNFNFFPWHSRVPFLWQRLELIPAFLRKDTTDG